MASPCIKKRKIEDESRVFQAKWTDLYFFTDFNKKPICLICKESISVLKEYNIKRHYETNVHTSLFKDNFAKINL